MVVILVLVVESGETPFITAAMAPCAFVRGEPSRPFSQFLVYRFWVDFSTVLFYPQNVYHTCIWLGNRSLTY